MLRNECADKHLVHQMAVVFIIYGYCCHLVVICGATSTGTSAFPLTLHHPSMSRLAMAIIPSSCRWDTAWWNGERPFAWAWSMRKKARGTCVLGSTRLIRHSPFDILKQRQMTDILQTTFSSEFSWKKIIVFWFHWRIYASPDIMC